MFFLKCLFSYFNDEQVVCVSHPCILVVREYIKNLPLIHEVFQHNPMTFVANNDQVGHFPHFIACNVSDIKVYDESEKL